MGVGRGVEFHSHGCLKAAERTVDHSIDSSPIGGLAQIERRREDGHSSSYLFAASSEKAFERKRNVRPLLREDAPV